MALPSDFTLRQSSALSSHGGMRGLMDAVLERRSLRSRQICSREQLKKYAPRICHAEVGRMQIKSPSKDLEDPTIVAPSESRQQNEDLNASFSRSNRNVQLNVEKSRTKAKKTHCRELSLSRKIVSKSRRRSSSLTAVFDGPYERVVANEKQPTEEASLCTGAYLHRAFSLRTTSSEREGKLASYRRRRGDACSSITTHSVSIDTGVPREIHPYFVVPLPVNNDFKPGKQQRFQEDISRADTDVACPQKLVVSAKQGNENGVIPRTILSPRDVHLVECRNTSEYQSSSQHATRSSMRCSRQRRRYNTQTESFGVNAPRFERGIVQLRDSRRRTAEIMRQRRSQPDMSVHSDEQLLQQSDFHAATKVKFLNDDKPAVMNKWIRAAKTSSAYANIAFEKSSILSKHDAEQSKLHSLERDKSHSVIASQRNLTKNKTSAHQEPHRESGQTQRGGVLMVGGSVCESKKKRRLKSSNGNTAAERSCDVQKNIQNLQSHMEGLSLNSLPVSKVFRTLNVMKEKYLLQSILYADSEPDSLSDKENIIPRKILSARAPQAADDCRSGGNDCICHQEILQLNRRSISNYLQEMDNLQLVDYSSDVEDGLHSNARLKSASSDCITWISKKNIIEDEMRDCLKICKVHDVGDIDIDSKPSSCTTSTERTSHSSSSKKHSSSWFVPLNGEGRVCEVLCANNPHSSLNVMVINDEKEDANDGDLCDHECDDHVNAIASFSDGERSRHRKQIVSTDERGENAAAWPRPRGREVLANVAVEERILSQQCADRPVINPATQTLTATQQSDPHPSDLLKQSLLQSDHFVEDCSKKREDRVLEIKEYVEKREAGSKAPNTSNPPPLADTPNSTVTVQERVGEPECEPMANGEHTQASGLCSDRSSSDVERILHNPVYRRPFQQFLEQQFCAENINFYVAVEEYRSIPDNEMERRSKVARQIYERHFTANSIEPVNIDNSTSRCIRDAVMAQRFSAQLYDVAQYQIFHLLKYDCWPRYLRAGGVAPNFDDARGEDHPGPSTQPTQPSQQQSGDKKRKSLLWRGLKPRFSRRKKESRTTSSIQSYSNGGSPQTAETRSCGGVETDRHSPVERFASGGTPTAIVSSPLSVGGQIARVTFSGPPCSPQPCGSFDSVGDEQLGEVFSATDASMSTRMTWSGSKRRHRFTNLGKQFSVPAELSYGQRGTSARGSSSTSVSPNRSRQLTSEVCTRFCTLMHNEIASSEQIPLSDPTESVGKWTSVMAAKRGMDPRATEAVDAQSLSTIDPARQAMDALNNRCVCLVPVLHFAVEILAPNASTKTGSSNSRIVLLRTRHGLSSGVVLRSVLSKFSLDYDACVAVLSGTLEVIASHISVGTVGSRCITVMTQQQYQERQHSPKREIVKDALISAHLLSPDANVPFFQHGDVAFFELPPDFDPRTGKINAARSYSNAKTEHTSGLLKFVRKASQAVTSREQDAVAPSSSTHQAHHHSGHNHHSSTMTSSYAHKIRRKSVDTFQRASSATAASDIPYCGENNFSDEQYAKSVDKRPEANASTEPTVASRASVQTPADGRGKVYELPDFLRRENCLDSSSVDTGESKLRYCAESVTSRGANGNATRIPPIYASAVPSKKDLTPCEVEKSIVWQPADYV